MAPPVTRTFAPDPRSVPAARRFVRQLVEEAGLAQWVGDAQVAVSELCTNVVLHAHTSFEVVVQVCAGGVHVQVWDDDPVLPARRVSGPTSTTGRGLELLAALATASGVQAVGPSKVAWFSLGDTGPQPRQDVLLDRDRTDGADAQPDGPGVAVVLRSMPVQLWLAAREHHNTLMRELSLHQQAAPRRPGQGAGDLVAADRARSLVLAALRTAEQGPTADLHLTVGPEQRGWFVALRDVLDGAERMAVDGALLAAPGPPEVVAVRHWAAGQVLAQLHGAAPTAWSGPLGLPAPGAGLADTA